jgi:hypothetical protein
MRKHLRKYNYLSADKGDSNTLWMIYAAFIGFAGGVILTVLILTP